MFGFGIHIDHDSWAPSNKSMSPDSLDDLIRDCTKLPGRDVAMETSEPSDSDDLDCALMELLEETADVHLSLEMALKQNKEKLTKRSSSARPLAGVRRERFRPIIDDAVRYDPVNSSPIHRQRNSSSHKRESRDSGIMEMIKKSSNADRHKATQDRAPKLPPDRAFYSPSDMTADITSPKKFVRPDYSELFPQRPSFPQHLNRSKNRSLSLNSTDLSSKRQPPHRNRKPETPEKTETPLPVKVPDVEHWEDSVEEFRICISSSPDTAMSFPELLQPRTKPQIRPKIKDIVLHDLHE